MDHFTTIVPLLSMVLNPDSQGGLDSRLHHHIRENRYASSIRNMHRSMNFEKKKTLPRPGNVQFSDQIHIALLFPDKGQAGDSF